MSKIPAIQLESEVLEDMVKGYTNPAVLSNYDFGKDGNSKVKQILLGNLNPKVLRPFLKI